MSRRATIRMKDLPPTQRKRVQREKRIATAAAQAQFMAYVHAAGLPTPQPEHRFHPARKWRFDWAFVEARVALEVEGGVWTEGRHTRGAGFVADMAKYNEAAALGWRIVRCVPDDLHSPALLDLLRRALSV